MTVRFFDQWFVAPAVSPGGSSSQQPSAEAEGVLPFAALQTPTRPTEVVRSASGGDHDYKRLAIPLVNNDGPGGTAYQCAGSQVALPK